MRDDGIIRIIFYEFAVVNFVRVGMWKGLGFDPLFLFFDTIDYAFASSPMNSETNLGGIYLAISVLFILVSIGVVVLLGKSWWGLVTIGISFMAGWGIGAANIYVALLVVPSMLLGIYAPLTQKKQTPRRGPPVR